eukprot:140660-Hanusia_phi.AAC.1
MATAGQVRLSATLFWLVYLSFLPPPRPCDALPRGRSLVHVMLANEPCATGHAVRRLSRGSPG